MKRSLIILFIMIISLFKLISNEVDNDINKEENISFKIKPSIFFSGSSIEFFDNNNNSYGDMVYNRGFWLGTGTYNNNLKAPVSENVNILEVQKLCRKYYSLINFMIGTITSGVLSLLIIPGVFMVINSVNYPYNSNEFLILYASGFGLIGGGIASALILIVYGIILIVFGVQYSKLKKSILAKLNNPELSINTEKIIFKFDLLLSFNK